MSAVLRPQREAGAWLAASDENESAGGCDVCGWFYSGPYGDVRQKWLEHEHDPLLDIKSRMERLGSAIDVWLRSDLAYLIDRVERAEASR